MVYCPPVCMVGKPSTATQPDRSSPLAWVDAVTGALSNKAAVTLKTRRPPPAGAPEAIAGRGGRAGRPPVGMTMEKENSPGLPLVPKAHTPGEI